MVNSPEDILRFKTEKQQEAKAKLVDVISQIFTDAGLSVSAERVKQLEDTVDALMCATLEVSDNDVQLKYLT